MTSEGCPGSSVETDACNEGSCPTWSNWSEWGDCSASCDGGTQSRTRTCRSEQESDCVGSATDEQQCNRQSCDGKLVYWDGYMAYNPGLKWVRDEYLPDGERCAEGEPCADTMLERCASYCVSHYNCMSIFISFDYYVKCHISGGGIEKPPSYAWFKWTTIVPDEKYFQRDNIRSIIAYTKDYYQSNLEKFNQIEPTGTVGGENVEIQGLCDKTTTGFGTVNYKTYENVGYVASDDKNVIRESDTSNCAKNCFEKAGCSAFFLDANECSYIIGTYETSQNDDVIESGNLSANRLCPSNPFKSYYTRRSQFYCLIWAPAQAENLADLIIQENTGNPDSPLGVWSFQTPSTENSVMSPFNYLSENAIISSSQYVTLSMPDMEGNDGRYIPVLFSIETHIRVGRKQTNRKRRSAADILAEIEAIEQQASSFILDGAMTFPDDVKIAATSPIETVEFVQTAADGSVAADCSSGTCECSVGFIDNGNGCEQMTEEQAATTQAPTTTQVSTTTKVHTTTKTTAKSTTQGATVSAVNWIPSLVDKIEAVFEQNRPGKSRVHLLKKWETLSSKFVGRFRKLSRNGCEFVDTYTDNSVDFDTVEICRVSFTQGFTQLNVGKNN